MHAQKAARSSWISDLGKAKFGSIFFFVAAIALPIVIGSMLSAVSLSGAELLVASLLVLNTSLLCVLIGLVLPLFVGRGAR